MTSLIPKHLTEPFSGLILAVADDKLMLGHRNSDWTGLAPILEEDIAFSSISQDNVAHALNLYEVVASLLNSDVDALAFGRSPGDYRCAGIVEVPDSFDWATAMARQFFCTHFDLIRYSRLAACAYQPLADLCARLMAEQRVQTEHVNTWIDRLGCGTEESRERLQRALDTLSPLAPMLFEPVDDEDELVSAGLYPIPANFSDTPFDMWRNRINERAESAGLTINLIAPQDNEVGGRRGCHTKYFDELLDEMCEVYRLEPNHPW